MNHPLEFYISKLLFDHECVIVPGIGAFLTRAYQAEFNTATNMLRPAHKRVVFNSRIKESDGLLIQYIANYEGLKYSDAQQEVKIASNDWKLKLGQGVKLNLKDIGRLYTDKEHRLQFSPAISVNYDLASYGLHIFRAEELRRREKIEESIQRAIVKEAPQKAIAKKSRSNKLWKAAAVLIPAIGLSVLFINNSQKLESGWQQISNLNPVEWVLPISNDHQNISSSFSAKADLAEVLIEGETPSSSQVEEISTTIHKFHLIVGSFKEEANAQKYISSMKAKGYEAYLSPGDLRFNRVSVAGFSTKQEAESALSQIQKKLNKGAWIYSN